MSLEESIQDHAAAMRELAGAIRFAAASARDSGAVRTAISTVANASYAELETTVTCVETDAKAAQKRAMEKVEAEKTSTAKETIQKALDAAKAAKADPKPAADLDYKKDVYPALVALGKKDRAGLTSLLEQFGVKSGDKLVPAQFADIIAAAQKLTAA